VHASKKSFSGPTRQSYALPDFPDGQLYRGGFVLVDEATQAPLVNTPYAIERANGERIAGMTDERGRTSTIYTPEAEDLTLTTRERDPEPIKRLYRFGVSASYERVLDYMNEKEG
jgi:type VI secretion system secreted protein VgrG